MKAVIQRVSQASVKVDKKLIGQIDRGLLVLFGVGEEEEKNSNDQKLQNSKIRNFAKKILNLRIFGDKNAKMNLSVKDINGEILVVPQFTLYADCSRGNRPSFVKAASPESAKKIFLEFIQELKKSGLKVEKGKFGAKMKVELVNDGPVTINIEL